jgi:hypothetical protein
LNLIARAKGYKTFTLEQLLSSGGGAGAAEIAMERGTGLVEHPYEMGHGTPAEVNEQGAPTPDEILTRWSSTPGIALTMGASPSAASPFAAITLPDVIHVGSNCNSGPRSRK